MVTVPSNELSVEETGQNRFGAWKGRNRSESIWSMEEEDQHSETLAEKAPSITISW